MSMAIRQTSTRLPVGKGLQLHTHRWISPYSDADKRPTIVFLHYWGGSHRTWNGIATRLAEMGLHCVAYDARGWGQSTRDCPTYTLEAMADDVEDVVRQLGLRDNKAGYILAGHSMGGRTAMLYMARQHNHFRMRALVLLATSPPVPQPMHDEERHALASMHSMLGSDQVIIDAIINRLSRTQLDDTVIRQIVQDTRACCEAAWRIWPERNMLIDLRDSLVDSCALAHVPVIILNSADDPVEALSTVDTLVVPTLRQAGATTVHVHALSSMGHLPPYEAPNEVAQAIYSNLKSNIVPSPIDVGV